MPYTIPHTELLVPEDSLKEYAGLFEEPNPYITEAEHYRNQKQPRAAYAAMITRLDRQVGEVMELLKRLQLEQNTIVFFTSDNGPQGSGGPDLEFFDGNGPFRGAKGMMYEGGIRTPMIVRWPDHIEPNSTNRPYLVFPRRDAHARRAGGRYPACANGYRWHFDRSDLAWRESRGPQSEET